MVIGIYSRISSQKEGNTSVEAQEKRGIEFAQSKSLQYKLYTDTSISGGAEIEDRPAFSKLLDDVEKGTIKAIYISNNDRAARNESTWFTLVDIIVKNQVTLYENGVLVDFEDDSVIMMQGIKAVIAANYRRSTGKKQKRRLLQNAKEGQVHGAVLPYGYSKDENKYLIIDNEEAEVVRLIFKLFLEGGSINGIATHLINAGIKTRFQKMGGKRTYVNQLAGHTIERDNTNSEWSRTVIKKILLRPLYKGVRNWNDEQYPLPHLAIIDVADWDKVNKSYLSNKGAIKGKVSEHKYLLPPLLQCTCGELFYGHAFSATRAYYKCRSYRKTKRTCLSKAQPIEPFDNFITSIVFGGLYDKAKTLFGDGDDNQQKDYIKQLKSIEKELDKLKQSQSRINTIYADGDYTKEEFKAQKKRIESKYADLNIKLSNIKEVLKTLEAPKNILQDLEDTIIKPFFKNLDKQGYPYDTTNGNPITDKFKQIFKAELAIDLPRDLKQKVFRKYIQTILVGWDAKNNVSIVEVSYKLPIANQKYIIDSTFLVGVEYGSRSTVYVNSARANYQTGKTNNKKFKAITEIKL